MERYLSQNSISMASLQFEFEFEFDGNSIFDSNCSDAIEIEF